MNPRQMFFAKLTGLAQLCGFCLTRETVALYEQHLSPLGFERVCWALDQSIAARRSRDPLPSIRDLREIVEPGLDPESLALEAAARIAGAVARIGPYDFQHAREFIGPIGWQVVQIEGGWQTVCETLTFDNLGMMKAQWRNLARVQAERKQYDYAHAIAEAEAEPSSQLGPVSMETLFRRLNIPLPKDNKPGSNEV